MGEGDPAGSFRPASHGDALLCCLPWPGRTRNLARAEVRWGQVSELGTHLKDWHVSPLVTSQGQILGVLWGPGACECQA